MILKFSLVDLILSTSNDKIWQKRIYIIHITYYIFTGDQNHVDNRIYFQNIALGM